MSHRSLPVAAGLTLLALSAGGAGAQVCLGLPTWDGQLAVAGTGEFAEVDRYGAEFDVDVSGPAAFGFAYGRSTSDGESQLFSGRLSYDFFLVEPAVCAVAGVRYATDEAPGVDERLGVPVGIGIGKRLRGERVDVIVYGVPQYVWLQEKLAAATDEDTVTSNEFQAEAGVTLGFLPFYVGGAVVVSTFDDADPALRIRAGLTF